MNFKMKNFLMIGAVSLSLCAGVLISTNSNTAIETKAAVGTDILDTAAHFSVTKGSISGGYVGLKLGSKNAYTIDSIDLPNIDAQYGGGNGNATNVSISFTGGYNANGVPSDRVAEVSLLSGTTIIETVDFTPTARGASLADSVKTDVINFSNTSLPITGFRVMYDDAHAYGLAFNSISITADVSISTAVLDSISYTGTPMAQSVGAPFNATGLVFTGHYDDTSTVTLSSSALTFNPTTMALDTTEVVASLGDVSVTITGVTVQDYVSIGGIVDGNKYFITGSGYYLPAKEITNKDGNAGVTYTDVSDIPATNAWIFESAGALDTWHISDGTNYLSNINDNDGVRTSTTPQAWEVSLHSDGSLILKGVNDRFLCFRHDLSAKDFRVYSNTGYGGVELIEFVATSLLDVVTYINAENVDGQCNTRFSVAKTMLFSMNVEDQETFKSSTDASIAAARLRYEAWASHLGEDPYSMSSTYAAPEMGSNNATMILTVGLITLVSISGIAGYYFISKRKNKQ